MTIQYDSDSESPRLWDNLGLFLTKESNYYSPDGKENQLYDIMIEAREEADSSEDHMELIKREAKNQGIKVLHIVPVNRYEHGNVIYRQGIGGGFDCSNCGFYIITEESQKNVGTKKTDWSKSIDSELETYTKWVNGDVYSFVLLDENGEDVDSCCGFYDIEDIREYLPEEYKEEDLNEYIIN